MKMHKKLCLSKNIKKLWNSTNIIKDLIIYNNILGFTYSFSFILFVLTDWAKNTNNIIQKLK